MSEWVKRRAGYNRHSVYCTPKGQELWEKAREVAEIHTGSKDISMSAVIQSALELFIKKYSRE